MNTTTEVHLAETVSTVQKKWTFLKLSELLKAIIRDSKVKTVKLHYI